MASNGTNIFTRTAGLKEYELKDYVGNVRAVVSDTKSGSAQTFYDALASGTYHYYPFGMAMPGLGSVSGQNAYRYGYNGKEKDADMKGNDATYDYGFRIYDARIAKFLSVDPLTKSYPWYTPYQFAGNKPIYALDLDGLEEYPFSVHMTMSCGNTALGFFTYTIDVFTNGIREIGQGVQLKAQNMQQQNDPGFQQNVPEDIQQKVYEANENKADNLINKGLYDYFTPIHNTMGLAYGALEGEMFKSLIKPTFGLKVLESTAPVDNFVVKIAAKSPNSFENLLENPRAIWGKSADEVGEILGSNWEKSKLNSGEGWKFTQKNGDGFVSYTTGNSHHPNSTYYKLNSGKGGKNKVVQEGYKATKGDKSTLFYVK